MNAKEERLHNLEVHKMTRTTNETISKNVALEAECKHLRMVMKQESEKHAANHAAMMQRMNQAIELEREKLQAMQRQFEKEQERLIDQSYKDAIKQRATYLESLGDIKRELDMKCTQKLNENKAAFDIAMRDLDQERERIKRDEQSHIFKINEEREHIKRELNEARERIKRDEKEQVMHLLNQLELEREKVQHQAEKECEIMMEKLHKEIAAQRELNEDNMKEMNRSFIANWDVKMKHLDIAMQKLNDERDHLHEKEEERIALMKEEREQMRQAEKERIARMKEEQERLRQADEERTAWMKEEQERLRQADEERAAWMKEEQERMRRAEEERAAWMKEEQERMREVEEERVALMKEEQKRMRETEEERIALMKEEQERMRQAEEERIVRMKEAQERMRQKMKQEEDDSRLQFLAYMESEREKLQAQLKNDRAQALKEVELQRQLDLDTLKELESQFNAKRNEDEFAFECEMQQLNQERAHVKQQLDEERERNARDEVEREKLRMLELQLENERKQVAEQAKKDAEKLLKSNEDVLASSRQELAEEKDRNIISFDAAMQKLIQDRQQLKKLEREQMNAKLIEERERNARDEVEREKIRILQVQLENERRQVAEQAKKDAENFRKFSANVLADMNRQMELELNKQMKTLNEEREQIKRNELERKKIERERAIMLELAQKDEVTKREYSMNELKQRVNEQLNAKLNELTQEKENMKIQLNEEREKIKEQIELETYEYHQELLNGKQQLINDKQQLNDEILQLKKQMNEVQETNAGYQSKINELNAQLTQSVAKLKETFYSDVKKQLRDAVDSNFEHMRLIIGLDLTDKRVLIYSHYSEYDDVESYNVLSLECVEYYFDYIVVLTNCPNKWNIHSPNYNKYYLLNYNMKSDFRNYGLFIMQTEKTLMTASRLCFMNDSFVIVDVNAYGLCMKTFFNTEMARHDFGGLTSSHEGVFHLQSYLLCFNGHSIPHLLAYFETNGLPANHGTAIGQYELGITKHLIEKGFSSYAVVSNDDMRFPLNTTCCKWEKVLEKTGIIKRQHFLKKYAYAAMTDANIAMVATNHFYNKHFIHFLNYHGINQKSV